MTGCFLPPSRDGSRLPFCSYSFVYVTIILKSVLIFKRTVRCYGKLKFPIETGEQKKAK